MIFTFITKRCRGSPATCLVRTRQRLLSNVVKNSRLASLTSTYGKQRESISSNFVKNKDAVEPYGSFCQKTYRTLSTAVITTSMNEERVGIPFNLADIGEGIAEVELLQWFVEEGDEVQQFDRICEVQSDKATVEITSRYDGVITSLEHSTGEMVKVGTPLLFLEEDNASTHMENLMAPTSSMTSSSTSKLHTASTDVNSIQDDEKLHIPTIASKFNLQSDPYEHKAAIATSRFVEDTTMIEDAAVDTSSAIRPSKVLTTPAIRKLGKEYDLDLSTIVGTGPKGRVLKGDVLKVLKQRGLVLPKKSESTQPSENQEQTTVSKSERETYTIFSQETANQTITSIDQAILPLAEDATLEVRGYNRLMIQSMTASLQIPHMVYADEVQVNQLMEYKKDLPFFPFIIKAVSCALQQYPLLNASYDATDTQITLWKDHNIGIAMDTPRGLIVPVIKKCQERSIFEIADELNRLKDLAQNNAVPTEDLQGATFSLSNIGAIGGGGTYMSPIVTPPQVAIGAIGQIQRLPRFVDKQKGGSLDVEEAFICTISWGGDHRVVDGATLARFHTLWKGYMSDPMTLIQNLK